MSKVSYEPQAGDYLECEHGSMCCWQQWNGVDSLDEGDGRHALTVLSVPPVNEKIVQVLPPHANLMRVLWETDPEVVAFVERVGDFLKPDGGWVAVDIVRKRAAYETAWSRREPTGSRERADKRAVMMLVKLSSEQTSNPQEKP